MPGDLSALSDWQVASSSPGSIEGPADLTAVLEWIPAPCPGTAASALRVAGRWSADGPEVDFDASDWWFRASFDVHAGRPAVVRFGGIATIADVWLDGAHVLHSENMFVAHELAVAAGGTHDLVVVCRSLDTWLAERRPRGSWKTRLVAQQQLRWARTTLLGRMPTWPPRAAPVGLWRPVEIIGTAVARPLEVRAEARLADDRGVVNVVGRWAAGHCIAGAVVRVGDVESTLAVENDADGGCTVRGSAHVVDPALWWPRTHGEPTLHVVEIELVLTDGCRLAVAAGSVGFRTVIADRTDDGFRISVNDVPIFCRGACWVPIDPVALSVSTAELEHALRQVVDAGMNMVRVTGTMVYEQREFHELCDRLGLLVWQDLMFANMDYPVEDEDFVASIGVELTQLLAQMRAHPSIAVICGGSEVEQQSAMMGIDQAEVAHRLGREVLAAAVAEHLPDVVYVSNSPSGGVFPFSVSSGVSHYYGVGAYRRPLEDARRADVRFTSECLAFSNVPTRLSLDPFLDSGDRPGHSPRWKQAVPRDRSAGWDFEDVRDHYVAALFGVNPIDVRWADPERYLDLGRAAVAVAIESTLGEWRRPGSRCDGALMFTLRDLVLGAGWGVIDVDGRPKSAYYAAARASAAQTVIATDEGLNGLAAHLLNDRPTEMAGTLVARLFDVSGNEIAAASADVSVAAHSAQTLSVDGLFTGFRDLSYAYRFGPLAVHVVALQLLDPSGATIAESCFLPGGQGCPLVPDVGLAATADRNEDGTVDVRVSTAQFAQFVSLDLSGHDPDHDWFHLAPGAERTVRFTASPLARGRSASSVEIRALNGRAVLSVPVA